MASSSKKQRTLTGFFSGENKKQSESQTSNPVVKATEDHDRSKDGTPRKKSKSNCSGKTVVMQSKFNQDWLNDYKWLRVEGNEGDEIMFCRICEEAQQANGFVKGSVNRKKSALNDHRESQSHHKAVLALTHRQAMAACQKAQSEKNDDSLTAMCNTVLTMAQENIAANKFNALITLQKNNKCSALSGLVYSHGDSVQDIEQALATSTIEHLKGRIANSKFVGLIIDETVNITVEKKLIMFLRIINYGKADTVFLGNHTVHDGTASTITDKIKEVFREWNIPINKVVGLGSDGASVMTGHKSGVGVRLTDECPFLVHVHCIAHRVSLASHDAAKMSKVITDFTKTVNEIYKLYQYSAVRYERLRDLSQVLSDTEFSSLKQPCSVRWLSLGRAVKSTKDNLPALCMEIEEEATARQNAVATGLQKKMKTFSFVALCYMLTDVLHIMDKLITVFQRDELNLGCIHPVVNGSIESLSELLTSPGPSEQYFLDNISDGVFRSIKLTHDDPRSRTAFQNTRSGFITDLCDALRKRFPEDSLSVIVSLDKILNPSKYPSSRNDIGQYGSDSLEVVLAYFTSDDVTVNNLIGIDTDRARRDFSQFKRTLANLGTKTLTNTCRLLVNDYQVLFPDFAVMATIALTIPVSSVPAERGFSLQNRIHTASRNRLSRERLDNLMLLNMHADDNVVPRAVQIFRQKKRKV
ncbi:zinc finger protein 862-like [Haliotis rubra]|uniref:zinc finger protein 862-like n=1 Tax=Haliotis rubra TaxID=36100 RepID=UPI001EE51A1E|nr:zinc finger protein 862-like [Haliotis rubra]